MSTRLVFPDLAPTLAWLQSVDDPAANLVLRKSDVPVPWSLGAGRDRERVMDSPPVIAARRAQRDSGSWGERMAARARILSTLWVLKPLVEVGLDAEPSFMADALGFLDRHAFTPDGFFSTTGTDRGVLSCYVGLAARLYGDLGRHDVADRQRAWLDRYQHINVDGEARRAAAEWGYELDTRYGGCFAQTSCVIGVARAAHAWAGAPGGDQSPDFVTARQSLLERELAFERRGDRVLKLSSTARRPRGWTTPAFPTDWRIDLVDMLVATATGERGPDARAQRAIDLLAAEQRPDGSWIRGWHVTSPYLKGFGAAPRDQGNPIVTARVVASMARWGAPLSEAQVAAR